MIETRTYIQAEVSAFLRTSDAFGGLSNMHAGYPITVAGIAVPSTENYYQAMRYPHLPDFQAEILAEPRPVPAKRLAYTRVAETRSDWQKVNITLMRHAMRLRYGHHPHAMQEIFERTAGSPIVEISSRDDFWGTFAKEGLLTGKNVLGRLYMELREEVAEHDPDTPFEVAAPDIADLTLCGRQITTFTPEAMRPAQASFEI
jgi:N-glycosidase YbiA